MIEPKRHKLKNGLRIIFIPNKSVESVAVILKGMAGSRHENRNQVGIAHFLEHLVFDGTEKYPTSKELESLIESLGGMANAATSSEYVEYWTKGLKQHIESSFEYLSQLFLHPLLKEKDIKKEKTVIEQEINRFKDSPGMYTSRLSYKLLYPNQRLGNYVSGDVEDIKKINKSNIQDFYDKNYVAENFVLVVCGNVEEKKVLDLAKKYFGHMRNGTTTKLKDPIKNTETNFLVENRSELMQSTLKMDYYSYHTLDDKKYTAVFLANILGGGIMSRLFQKLREEHGLVYSVGAGLATGTNFGTFSIVTGLAEDKIIKCLELIKTELKLVQKEKITKEEYESTLNRILASAVMSFEDPLSIAGYYANAAIFNPKIKTINDTLNKYKAVKIDQILDVANELFEQNPKITLLTKSLKQEQLEKTF